MAGIKSGSYNRECYGLDSGRGGGGGGVGWGERYTGISHSCCTNKSLFCDNRAMYKSNCRSSSEVSSYYCFSRFRFETTH